MPSSEGNAASRLGLTLDLWCKLNISSLIKLLHLLGCLICVKNIMIIVVLLKMMRDGNGGGWLIYVRVWVGDKGCYILSTF